MNAGQGTLNSGGVSGFALPVLRYYVGTGGEAQIDEFNVVENQLAPADLADFTLTQPIIFTWPSVPQTKYYKLLIENSAGVEMHSAVLLRDTHTYRAPSWLLEKATTNQLLWRVMAIDAKGTKLSETPVRTLRRISE